MENKKIYYQFVAVNLHKKQHWGSWKLTGSNEKSVEVRDKLQDTISKGR